MRKPLCLFALLAASCPADKQEQRAPPPPPDPPAMQVKISDIGEEIEQNAVAARSRYSGNLLEFTGRLWTIDATPGGGARLGIFTVPPVRCDMRLGQDESIAQMKPSTTQLRVRGRLTGYSGGVLSFEDCRVVSWQ